MSDSDRAPENGTTQTPRPEDVQLADMFFDYLRAVVYSPRDAKLDLDDVPFEWRDFAKGLQYLDQCVIESDRFADELSRGNLDAPLPSAENGLAGPLKTLQSALSHLAWQANEIAKGDFEQRVDFMGDLGSAFNSMMERLEEREEILRRERDSLERINRELQSTHEMMSALAVDSSSFIVIYDDETKEPVFVTEMAREYMEDHPRLGKELAWTLKSCSEEVYEHAIHWKCSFSGDTADHPAVRLSVSSHSITWGGKRAVAHMIVDDSQDLAEELAMQDMAYRDPLTGLFNRRYGMEQANRLMSDGTPFSLAFIDLDNLKFSNDTFGHAAGDDYIMDVTNAMKDTLPQPQVICRIGGDEFMVIAQEQKAGDIIARLKHINRDLLTKPAPKSSLPYRSVSYGVVEVPTHPGKYLADYLEEADAIMYGRKQRHKRYMDMKTAATANRRMLDMNHRRQVEVNPRV